MTGTTTTLPGTNFDDFLVRLVDHCIEARFDVLVNRLATRLQGLGTAHRDELLNVHEAAEHLGLSPSTVYKRAESGLLQSVKDGGRLLFRRDHLDAYVESNTRSRGRTAHDAGAARHSHRAPSTVR